MIEKLKITASDTAIMLKINELVDAVNMLQLAKDAMFYAIRNMQNRIAALDDPTYHKTEPEPTENMSGPIKLYVCADGSVYDNEDVAKSSAASIFNQLPAGATTTDRVYLEQELERTRKALDVAKERLKNTILDAEILATPEYLASRAKETLDEITALEQKE